MANQAQGAPMGGGAQPSSVTSAAAAGGASAKAQGAQHDARAAAQEKKAKAKKPKVGVFRWKGILGNSRPIVRKSMLLLIAVAIATLAFTQLGLTGLGVPGNFLAYGNVMLSAIVLAGLLFGIPWGTALGVFAGIMMAAHAAIQPLDYYEITFMASVPSIIMFTFVGFFGSLFLSLVLRRNPGTVRRIVRIVIICLVIAFFYSVFFVTSAVFEIVKQLVNLYADAGEVVSFGDLSGVVELNMGLLGRVDIQFLFDVCLMILTCIVADAIVRKSRKTEGNHSMIVLFRAWLLGIVALVFMVTSVVSFVTITETAKATAKQDMDEEIAYLANQLDIFDTRSGLMR